MKQLSFILSLTFAAQLWGQSTIQIELSPNISLSYYPSLEYFKKDSLYKEVEENYVKYREEIISSLQDTGLTDLENCAKSTPLRKGDLAWMLLRELKKIPKDCSIRRFNIYKGMCPHPQGLLDYFEENRIAVAAEISQCIE